MKKEMFFRFWTGDCFLIYENLILQKIRLTLVIFLNFSALILIRPKILKNKQIYSLYLEFLIDLLMLNHKTGYIYERIALIILLNVFIC